MVLPFLFHEKEKDPAKSMSLLARAKRLFRVGGGEKVLSSDDVESGEYGFNELKLKYEELATDDERRELLPYLLDVAGDFAELTWVYQRARKLELKDVRKAAHDRLNTTGGCQDWLDLCRHPGTGDQLWFSSLQKALDKASTPQELAFVFIEIYDGLRSRPFEKNREKIVAELSEAKERIRSALIAKQKQGELHFKTLAAMIGMEWVLVMLYETAKTAPPMLQKLSLEKVKSLLFLSPQGSALYNGAFKRVLQLTGDPGDMLMLFEKCPCEGTMREQIKSIILRKTSLADWEAFLADEERGPRQWELALELVAAQGEKVDEIMRVRDLVNKAPDGVKGRKKLLVQVSNRISRALKAK